jgi:diketogulonate reductase-like aldo/keto reductase
MSVLLKADWSVWNTLEELYRLGQAKMIGISNVNPNQLWELIDKAEIKPMVVQNRCFAVHGWDEAVRKLCRDHDIIYQGFSLLTANWYALKDKGVLNIAQRAGKTPAQVIFRFAMQVGMVPLTGTTDEQHMKEDLKAFDFELNEEDVTYIERIGMR